MQVVKPYKMGIVKRLSDTRWSAHSDAVKALVKGYIQIKVVVELLATNNNQTSEVDCKQVQLSIPCVSWKQAFW